MSAIITVLGTILVMIIMLIDAMVIYKMGGTKNDGSSEG